MREDLSNYLVHWLKGETEEDSYQTLLEICIDECIRGSNGRGVYGDDKVICFSEAPAKIFHSDIKGEFKPFGVSIYKHDIFSLGGLPVIYQPKEQLQYLDKSIHWRHVDFNLTSPDYKNYTWQREWRLKAEQFNLNNVGVALLVPNKSWAERLKSDIHNENCNRDYFQYCMLGGYYEFPLVLSGKTMIIDLKII